LVVVLKRRRSFRF